MASTPPYPEVNPYGQYGIAGINPYAEYGAVGKPVNPFAIGQLGATDTVTKSAPAPQGTTPNYEPDKLPPYGSEPKEAGGTTPPARDDGRVTPTYSVGDGTTSYYGPPVGTNSYFQPYSNDGFHNGESTPPLPRVATPPLRGNSSDIKTPAEPTLHTANPNTILSRKVLHTYFQTFDYPFTRHHIDSFDQFLSQDLLAIIKANNPILVLKDILPDSTTYKYRLEIFIGGETGTELEIGTPTLTLQKTKEVRVLFPNEARLRNLTYSSTVYANVLVKFYLTTPGQEAAPEPVIRTFNRMPIFNIPILLHSRYCILHGKPESFLKEAGECPQDPGGYFIIGGAEKVLITRQEQAFNTLYIVPQPSDPKVATYANITSLSPITRQVKMVSFNWMRATDTLQVTLPYVRKPIPLFVLFRALGIQTDEDIFRLIYPDLNSYEAEQMIPLLLPSVAEANPFFDQYSAIQFIKAMTKGFSEAHVFDILFNQFFIHITDAKGGSRAHFLAECVRKFMRVHVGIESKTDRDDTRNQRCLTSGFLVRMLFSASYATWLKAIRSAINEEYFYNMSEYQNENFINIFSPGNVSKIFQLNFLTESLMRGFKGKWVTGGAGGGGALGHSDEKTGVLQAMSRLSYMDFMSHCRRVSLNFDTGMKLTGPRQLHGSQYGYFCTNEVPSGASIGIVKNLSLMTLISTASDPQPFTQVLERRGWILPCSEVQPDIQARSVPVFVNNGIVGYTQTPFELVRLLKLFKWTGCLPPLASVGYSIRNRQIFIYMDEGRPLRPLIHLGERGEFPKKRLEETSSWRELVLGTLFPDPKERGISTVGFIDPMAAKEGRISMDEYITLLEPHAGIVEYVDPYEQNEASIVNFPEHIQPESSHCEIHPCTIVSIVNGMVPFANHNQSPRNQLSCSQSKQALSLYATNFQNRYDNTANILCYGEGPLVRTLCYDILGSGQMPYGQNLIMAIMPFHGFNRDDGIIFNADSFQRGMFRNINYRSYTAFEEVDRVAKTTTVIANPVKVPQWTDLRPGVDYSKLDERGIIKVGEIVDEHTVLVGMYLQDKAGKVKDASVTAQVWTTGRVESVIVTLNNLGHQMVKVRVTQDRTPELGDKFSTRHGQKGTIGMLYRAHDLPRTKDGLVPDILVNPHCIPSRMTVAQLMETLFGKLCYTNSMIGDATLFMSDQSAPEAIGRILEKQFAMERHSNEVLYDGESGIQIPTTIFMGPVFVMRLKHMVEDKWNARAEGRREQRTHQPTGGRGAQGGLRIGEMDRDSLVAHGLSGFLKESLMERSDKTEFRICNGCGTIPIFNKEQSLFVCSLCDGPVAHIGTTASTLEILPTVKRTVASTSVIEMPYATKLLAEELQTYLNMCIRFLTARDLFQFKVPEGMEEMKGSAIAEGLKKPLPSVVFPETRVPEYREKPVEVEVSEENLSALGLMRAVEVEPEEEAAFQAGGGGGAPPPTQEMIQQEAERGFYWDDELSIFRPDPLVKKFGKNAAKEFISAVLNGPMGEKVLAEKRAKFKEELDSVPEPVVSPEIASASAASIASSAPPGSVTIQVGGPQPQAQAQVQAPLQPQPQPQLQPFSYMNSQTAPPPAMFMPSPLPQTAAVQQPMTVIVDTRPQAMAAQNPGFIEQEEEARMANPVMGGMRRHTTPRARPMSPRRGPVTFGDGQAGTPPPGTKFVVRKLE